MCFTDGLHVDSEESPILFSATFPHMIVALEAYGRKAVFADNNSWMLGSVINGIQQIFSIPLTPRTF